MEWYVIIFVIIIGISVGFINTLAGSGSVITLPLLIFLGLPATVANGTNRVAIFMQNVVGVSSFHQKKKLDIKGGAIPIIATVLGSVIGSNIAIDIHNEYLEKVIGVGMIIMFFVIIWQPKRWIIGNRYFFTFNIGFTIRIRFGKSQCLKTFYHTNLQPICAIFFHD